MFAVEFMERIAALSVNTTLEPMANLLTDTVCYIVNSPRMYEDDACRQSIRCKMTWDSRRHKYVPNTYLPVCDKV
jgi:hypothetical protein